jgi:hypothetical protein
MILEPLCLISGVHFGDFWHDFSMKIENWRKLEKSCQKSPKCTPEIKHNGSKIIQKNDQKNGWIV